MSRFSLQQRADRVLVTLTDAGGTSIDAVIDDLQATPLRTLRGLSVSTNGDGTIAVVGHGRLSGERFDTLRAHLKARHAEHTPPVVKPPRGGGKP